MTAPFEISATWEEYADRVAVPELRATWAALQVRVGDRCITRLRADGGLARDEVYGSAYPLAEWIVYNWWPLTVEQRPSALPERRWSWTSVPSQPWLARHNLRAAGDGMSWPNLTLVPEGDLVRLAWFADEPGTASGAEFAAHGNTFLPRAAVITGLRAFVDNVLRRLESAEVRDTPLAKEWRRIAEADADPEEADFCAAVARLGLDPYDAPDAAVELLPEIAQLLGDALLGDFLDSADPQHLDGALAWTQAARTAQRRARAPQRTLEPLRSALSDLMPSVYPWETGYEAARRVRAAAGLASTEVVEADLWVSLITRGAPSYGLDAFGSTAESDTCSLVVTGQLSQASRRFTAARGLGRAVLQPPGREFLLTPVRAPTQSMARAFAAEFLAPAEGIRRMLETLGREDDTTVETIARQFGVSPLVVSRQLDNQVHAF